MSMQLREQIDDAIDGSHAKTNARPSSSWSQSEIVAQSGDLAAKAFRIQNRCARYRKETPSSKRTEGVVGDIVERSVPDWKETAVSGEMVSGFPQARHRSQFQTSLSHTEVHPVPTLKENEGSTLSIENMTLSEIRSAKKEIRETLKPSTIAFLKKRGLEKAQKTTSKETARDPALESVRVIPSFVERLIFDLDGRVMASATEEVLNLQPNVVESTLQRDPLRRDEASLLPLGFYTLPEIFILLQSPVLPQRVMGLQILRNILSFTRPSLRITKLMPLRTATDLQRGSETEDLPKGLETADDLANLTWNAVWKFLLFDLDLVSLLRRLLNERTLAIVANVLEVCHLICMLSDSAKPLIENKRRFPSSYGNRDYSGSISRSSDAEAWQLDVSPKQTLAENFQQHLESGFLTDLDDAWTFLSSFDGSKGEKCLSTILNILYGLANATTPLVKAMIQNRSFLRRLRDATEQSEDSSLQTRYSELLCSFIENHPSGCSFLISEGFLDGIQCDFARWMNYPLQIRQDYEELLRLRDDFRMCRIWSEAKQPFISMHDLFPVTFPLLTPPEATKSIPAMLFLSVAEIFHSLTSSLIHQKTDQNPPSFPAASARSFRQAAFGWLHFDKINEEEGVVCFSAALRFVSLDFETNTIDWTIDTFESLSNTVKRWIAEDRFVEWLARQNPSSILHILISFLKLLKILLSRAHLDKAMISAFFNALCNRVQLQKLKPVEWHCFETRGMDEDGHLQITETDKLNASPWLSTEIGEMDDLLFLHRSWLFAECVTQLLETGSSLLDLSPSWWNEFWMFGCEAFTQFPPGSEALAIECLCFLFSVPNLHHVSKHVQQILQSETHRTTELWNTESVDWTFLEFSQQNAQTLLNGFLASFLHVFPDDQIEAVKISKKQNCWGSHLPLPDDSFWRPVKLLCLNHDNLAALKYQRCLSIVQIFVSERTTHPETIERRLTRLVEAILFQKEFHRFVEDPMIRCCFVYQFQKGLDRLPEKDALRGWTPLFLEALLDAFSETGDVLMGSVVACAFHKGTSLQCKRTVWKKLAEQKLLHLIPDQRFWFGKHENYLPEHPPEAWKQILKQSLRNGDLGKAKKLKASLFDYALQITQETTPLR